MEAIALDWSGAAGPSRPNKRICLARARDGELLELMTGLSRETAVAAVVELASPPHEVVVGLDFCFSMPAWYLLDRGVGSAGDLWRLTATEGEQWLAACDPPFWGRAGKRRPELPAHLRRTEAELAPLGGIRPKSVFQLGGAGSVGTGSVRGMPALARLQEAGFAIWPFDDPSLPVVVEIWPRLFTGPIAKSNAGHRRAHLSSLGGKVVPPTLLPHVLASEDAFDSALSAVQMSLHGTELEALRRATSDEILLEGQIWAPGVLRESTGAQEGGPASSPT